MFRTICDVARTELQLLFYSPIAWLLLIVFSLQSALLFCGQVDYLIQNKEIGYHVANATLNIFVNPWGGVFTGIQSYLYIYIPLLTMGLLSREVSSGSIKLLYSSPIKNYQIILGKYFAMMVYGALMVSIFIVFMLCGLFVVKDFDWPMVLCGTLGLYLLLCAYAAIGIFMSSLTSYQIVAAVGTLIVLMLLNMVGHWWQDYEFIRDITYWLSINGRSDSFIHGLICSEDVLYFVIVICLFILLTIIRLNAIRQKIRFSVTLTKNVIVIISACILGYFSSLPVLKIYYDTTETKQNTLTSNSQEIVSKLKGGLTLTTYINVLEKDVAWYATGNFLKPDIERFEQYLRFKPDMKLKYVYYYDTTDNPQLDKLYPGKSLREKMIEVAKIYDLDTSKIKSPQEIHSLIDLSEEGNVFVRQFVRKNGEKAWLRVFDDMSRFPGEREISAALKKTVMKLPIVGFVTGHGERRYDRNRDRDYSTFTNNKKFRYSLINQGFEIEYVYLDKSIRDDINIIVIAENRTVFTPEESAILREYIDRGGNMFVLGEPNRRDVMNPLFGEFGFQLMDGQLVKQDTNLQADVILSYPTEEAERIAYEFGNLFRGNFVVVTPGVSGLIQMEDKGFNVVELFRSDTINSWNEIETTNFIDEVISRNQEIGEIEVSYPTIVALSRKIGEKEQRILLSGDADCISNIELMGNRPGVQAANYALVLGGFYWLSNDEVPIDVRRPAPPDDDLYIKDSGASVLKGFLCVALPIVLVGCCVLIWFRRKGR